MYIHHSFPVFNSGSYYEPNYGVYEPTLTLRLEKGDYTVTFVEPATLKTLKEITVTSDGKNTQLTCPRYSLDLAVKIISKA
jgi:glutamine cyclotransferase